LCASAPPVKGVLRLLPNSRKRFFNKIHKKHKKDRKVKDFNKIMGRGMSQQDYEHSKPRANITNPSAAVHNL
jgi:hypothetical protein